MISPISSSIKPFFFSPYHSLIGIFVPFYLIFMICAWLQLLHDDLGHLKQPLTDLYKTPQSKFVVCSWLKLLDSRVFIFSVHKKYLLKLKVYWSMYLTESARLELLHDVIAFRACRVVVLVLLRGRVVLAQLEAIAKLLKSLKNVYFYESTNFVLFVFIRD